eukprot:5661815-Alexandrium_andersonii.AAC.1
MAAADTRGPGDVSVRVPADSAEGGASNPAQAPPSDFVPPFPGFHQLRLGRGAPPAALTWRKWAEWCMREPCQCA